MSGPSTNDDALVRVVIPAARGRAGPDDRRTFAVIVTGVDHTRPSVHAILGERVHGIVETTAGALLLVYGEDRDAFDGRLLFHCIDLYRVEHDGRLVRVDHGTLTHPWLGAVLTSIERAQRGIY